MGYGGRGAAQASHLLAWPKLFSAKKKKKEKSLQITNAGEYIEKREPSYTVGGNISWYKYYGKQHGGPSKKQRITTACSSKSCLGTYPKNKIWTIPLWLSGNKPD